MTIEVPTELVRRNEVSTTKLRSLSGALRAFGLDEDRHPQLAIFATGSLARGEASDDSDLDVFLVDTAAAEDQRLGRLQRYELFADLIRANESAGFPAFSRDGEFLRIHPLSGLRLHLGKPDEDRLNVFTARMLLLLESECLLGPTPYDASISYVLDRYWTDDGPGRPFRPTFLINDIVRYWKTLCLSWEGWRPEPGRALDAAERLGLLKLKFNRVWLCFNGLAFLLLGDADCEFPKSHARRLVATKPVERMRLIAAAVPSLSGEIAAILDRYAGFLTLAAAEDRLERLGDDGKYANASADATKFGDEMWHLVMALGDRAQLTRYLLM
jgi:predicted nucleotidyltransferase